MNKHKDGVVPTGEKVTVGPDGEFFRGEPVRPGDRGGCYAKFGRVPGERLLALDFGTTLQWIGVPPEAALQQAAAFRGKVFAHFGEMNDQGLDFPMKVIANKGNHLVETHFSQTVSVLTANPELFLMWAGKLEEAAKQLMPTLNLTYDYN